MRERTLSDYADVADKAAHDPKFFDEYLDLKARERLVLVAGCVEVAAVFVWTALLLLRV